MEHQSTKTIAKSIFSNWIGIVASAIITFFLTPFVLNSLGETRFGAWVLITSLTGYYGLLNMGFSQSLTYFFSRHLAVGDFNSINRDASTGFVALTICGLALIGASIGLAVLAPLVFTIEQANLYEVQWCLFIMGCSVALQFFFFVYSAVFVAKQRFDLVNAITISINIIYATGVVIILSNGAGLIGIVSWAACTNLLGNLVRWRVAKMILPELSLSIHNFKLNRLRGLARFSGWTVFVNASRKIIDHTDIIVIAFFLGNSAITPFYLAVRISNEFTNIFTSVGRVFFPLFAQLAKVNDDARTRLVYQRGTRLVCALTMTIGAVSFYWCSSFYKLWIGDQSVEGDFGLVPVLYSILLAKTLVALAQLMGNQIFSAKDKLGVFSLLIGIEAIANLAVSIVLLQWIGLVGVALGTFIPALIMRGIIQPIVVGRLIDLSMSSFLRSVGIHIGMFAASIGLLYLFCPNYEATSWPALIAGGLITIVPIGFLAIVFCFDSSDRKQFIITPLSIFRSRIFRSQNVNR